ncbi:MAG: hypothetical protein LC772_08055 [Chloroflexi bacterium]|nr:hypothetical protein [Chloroflexota bacterium]
MSIDLPPRVFLARAAALFLAVSAPVTVMAALVYASVQQNFRQSANDPQIAMAGDAIAGLRSGRTPSEVVPSEKVNFAASLSPYLMVLDESGDPLASSGEMDGRVPRIPEGVLEYVRTHGEERVTWQPRRDARCAIVVQRVRVGQVGFVVAGRSLREVEDREAQLTRMAGVGWIAALLAAAFASLLGALVESAVAKNAR